MIDDGSKDGGQTHDLSALCQTQNKQLIPACSHQGCVTFLPTHTERENWHTLERSVSIERNPKTEISPESKERWNRTRPVHGEEEQAWCRLTDIMHIQILGHWAWHRQLQRENNQTLYKTFILLFRKVKHTHTQKNWKIKGVRFWQKTISSIFCDFIDYVN